MGILEPCPFCGGKPYLETSHRAFIGGKSTRVAYVRCTECEARSGRFELRDFGKSSHSTEANRRAVAAWNARCEDFRTPLRPIKDSLADRGCPICNAYIPFDALNDRIEDAPPFCKMCGQALDWSEEAARRRVVL